MTHENTPGQSPRCEQNHSTNDRQHILVFRPGAFGDAILTFPALAILSADESLASACVVTHPYADGIYRRCSHDLSWGKIRFYSQDSPQFLPLFLPEPEFPTDSRDVYASLGSPNRMLCLSALKPKLYGAWKGMVDWRHAVPPKSGDAIHTHAAVGLAEFLTGRSVSYEDLADAAAGFHWDAQTAGLPEPEYLESGTLAKCPESGCIVMHLGSGSPSKSIPVETLVSWAHAIETDFSIRCVFLAGPVEMDRYGDIMNRFERVLVSPDPGWLASWLVSQRALIGADSGPGHLAAICGIPVVTWFIGTDPEIWKPVSHRSIVLDWRTAGPHQGSLFTAVHRIVSE